jgi:hypothetical protein
MNISRIDRETSLNILWILKNTRRPLWYEVYVKEILILDMKREYIVCNLHHKLTSENDKAEILYEKDYGVLWKFTEDYIKKS